LIAARLAEHTLDLRRRLDHAVADLSARLRAGQSTNASTYSTIRLIMGTSINRLNQPENPALAKIF